MLAAGLMVSSNGRLPPPWQPAAYGRPNKRRPPVIGPYRRRSGSALWTLADTATELLLLPNEAGTLTLTSGALSQIRDAKGNGKTFDGAAGSRPTITPNALNGKASITYSGAQWLTFNGFALAFNFLHTAAGAGSTVVAVWRAGTSSDPNAAYAVLGTSGQLTANVGLGIIYDDRASNARNDAVSVQIARGASGQPATQNVSGNGAHPANTPLIITHTSNLSAALPADRSILRINGTEIKNNTFTTVTNPASTANATFPLQIGAAGGNAFPLVGNIYMIGILPPGTTLDTIQRAEGYVAGPVAGWDLQANLAAGHPWKSAAPTV